MARKKRKENVVWIKAPDIKKRIYLLKNNLDLDWIKIRDIYCFRSKNSTSNAYARIWGLSKVWQLSLNIEPSYVIEVLSEKFDGLSKREQDKILLHEIAHIPKNFTGSLLAHVRRRGKRNFHDRVEELFSQYLRKMGV